MTNYFLFGKSRSNGKYRLFWTNDYKIIGSMSVESPDPKFIADPNKRYLDGSINYYRDLDEQGYDFVSAYTSCRVASICAQTLPVGSKDGPKN